ncbi:PepSY domain-containing protein [Thermomonas sp. S9]|uniref:PepSY domain-containing protein n=1 Tax=Thermomonas sp. S9 TaxID=2885203 RepID=UPI00216B44EF|nr:PepSY domain-containing protein [Thermomonas sp. S9]MCR6497005.1 PepSY domain-containing protein [Thermomonas sp. S9]
MHPLSRTALLAVLTTLALAAVAGTPPAARTSGISLEQARTIALKAAPGKIVKEEREKENGALRYSFDIQQDGKIHEIGVDVVTGKIVEDKFEDPANRD